MDKLTKTLKDINTNATAITEELTQSKSRTSSIINLKLKAAYAAIVDEKLSTKKNFLAVWSNIISRASRKFSRTWQRLFIEADKTFKIIYSNENTLESTLTEFRKPLKNDIYEPEIYKQSIYLMGVSQERSKQRKEEYKNIVNARNTARGGLVPIYIEQILELQKELIKSNNPYDLAVAVELATGARSIEVFKVSTFSENKDAPNEITVKGIAKDKGGNNLENVVLTRNLVGLTSKEAVKAVDVIRSSLNLDASNKEISDKTNRQLNKAFKKYIHPILTENAGDKASSDEFKAQLKSMTSHKGRYIAGNASYEIYGKPKNIPYETYLQAQYGHLDPSSTKSYLGINVKYLKELKNGNTEEVKEYINTIEKKVKDIKEEVDNCCGEVSDKIDLSQYTNSFTRKETEEAKINNVVAALTLLHQEKIKMKQVDLRNKLRYSGAIMTAGYKKARSEGVI